MSAFLIIKVLELVGHLLYHTAVAKLSLLESIYPLLVAN